MGARKQSQPPRETARLTIRRRSLIVTLCLTLIAALTGLWRLVLRREREHAHAPTAPIATTSSPPARAPSPQPRIFAPASWPILFAVADAIVPRFGDQPAASEIDLLPRLERCIELSPDGAEVFRDSWSRFEQELRQRVPARDGRLDPAALQETLEAWQLEYATRLDPPLAASYFEGLRRNVLLAYYTSPAGWASTGYRGPGDHGPSATGPAHE